ncbi:alcohol dehydrogenase zinc-binding domain-containing protein [Gongronella butleri]|nr:alcohol dehydrogenase zinc-binding domain-containing protein [Gongronella butleri]
MKAAVLREFGTPLAIDPLFPDPQVSRGAAIVKVLAVPVSGFYNETLQGALPLQLPIIPGFSAVGIVDEVGPDATDVKVGDVVFVDPTVRSRDNVYSQATIMQGFFAFGGALSDTYRHGAFAEKLLAPLENLVRIPTSLVNQLGAPKLTALNPLLVAQGALTKGNFRAGQNVVVLGGSGHFGSAVALLALVSGARKVIIPTRNPAKIDTIKAKFGDRVIAVPIKDTEEENAAAFQAAAGGNDVPIHLALDFLDTTAPMDLVAAAVHALAVNGTLVLYSGTVAPITLPYSPIMLKDLTIRGGFMYDRDAPETVLGLIETGQLDLNLYDTSTQFPLEDATKAIDAASTTSGAFYITVVTVD